MALYSDQLKATYGSQLSNSEHFPSPFLDMATQAMPEDIRTALQWCEYIFQSNGTYRQAMERIISYFLTDLEVGSADTNKALGDDEKEKWEDFLDKQVDMLGHMQNINRDRMCYGNGFASVVVPFRRHLVCPKCSILFPLGVVYENPKFNFSFKEFNFLASCPKCKYRGPWKVKDEPENSPDKLKIKRWSPHEIHILHDPYTDDTDYLWKIPEDYKRQVTQGRLYHLERVSRQVLDAIKHDQLFRFEKNYLYHMREPSVAGLKTRGWGISRIITNFRQVWYVQVLQRFNEGIALDYIIPFRLITPTARSGAGGQSIDPLLSINMGDFSSQVRSMVRRRRRDPSQWNTLPFPVDYQLLGGEARQLAPRELIDQGMETLLNAAGTPVELYKGTMQLQTAPVSLRLFEATWHHLVNDNNRFLRWIVERVSELLSWETVDVRHKRVTHADDMQRHMAILQLMMSQQVSNTTGLRGMGINWKDEQRLVQEEARYMQEQQAKVQEEMEQSAYGQQIARGEGGPGGGQQAAMGAASSPAGAIAAGGEQGGGGAEGGAPAPPPGPVSQIVQSGNMPQTPDEMLQQAESIAQQMLGLPEGQKDSELRMLKQKNEVLHSLVRSRMDSIRQQARMQGGSQVLQQQFGRA
jgi:hypothetical protein